MMLGVLMAGQAMAISVPFSEVLKRLGASPGAPANYFSDEDQLEYRPTLITSDDKERQYTVTAHRYLGKKYIYGVTTRFSLDLRDFTAAQEGMKLEATLASTCLNMGTPQITEIQNWLADKLASGMTGNGGSFRRNFVGFQANAVISNSMSPYALVSIWRTDKQAGTAKWANLCIIDGVLVY